MVDPRARARGLLGLERTVVQQDSEALSLAQVMEAFRHHVVLIALCAAIVGGSAFGFSEQEPNRYTATALLAFDGPPLSGEQVAALSTGRSNLPQARADEVSLVKEGQIVGTTAALLGGGITPHSLREALVITGGGAADAVSVSATSAVPVLAAKVANTFAREFAFHQRLSYHDSIVSALRRANLALAFVGGRRRGGTALSTLRSHARTLRILDGGRYGEAVVARKAHVPTSPTSPKIAHNTFAGLAIGLVVGLGLALASALRSRTRRLIEGGALDANYGAPVTIAPNDHKTVAPTSGAPSLTLFDNTASATPPLDTRAPVEGGTWPG